MEKETQRLLLREFTPEDFEDVYGFRKLALPARASVSFPVKREGLESWHSRKKILIIILIANSALRMVGWDEDG